MGKIRGSGKAPPIRSFDQDIFDLRFYSVHIQFFLFYMDLGEGASVRAESV